MLRTECVICLCGSCQSHQGCEWGCDQACGGKDGFPITRKCQHYIQESVKIPNGIYQLLMEISKSMGYRKTETEIVGLLIFQEACRRKLVPQEETIRFNLT